MAKVRRPATGDRRPGDPATGDRKALIRVLYVDQIPRSPDASSYMRKMPAFTKAPAETIERFEAATSGIEALERRTMFSYPSVFLNGNMLACVFQDRIMVRLSAVDRAVFLMMPDTKVFEPSPGRPMREYVEAPSAKEMAVAELRGWMQRAAAHVATLPKKSKAKKAAVKKATVRKKPSALKAKSRTPARTAKKSRAKGAKKRR